MKDELKRLKAGILALIMCLTLSGCASSEEKKEESSSSENYEYAIVTFVGDKAVIYDTTGSSAQIKESGVIKINENNTSFYLLAPSIAIPGMDNAIEYASSVVGEENVIIMDWNFDNGKEIILRPNN